MRDDSQHRWTAGLAAGAPLCLTLACLRRRVAQIELKVKTAVCRSFPFLKWKLSTQRTGRKAFSIARERAFWYARRETGSVNAFLRFDFFLIFLLQRVALREHI